VVYQVNGSRAEWNPSAARLRALTEKTPDAVVTEFGNVNVKARLDSRSTRSTYLVEDSTKFLRVPAISPFFPRDMADMGNRLLELLDSHEVQAFELNTGRVGAAGRHRDPPAPPALRPAGPGRRARGHGGPAQAGAEGIPRLLPRPGRSLVKSLGLQG
jgi:hypothetical protein